MAVKRIVANIAAPHPEAARAFYGDVLGLDLVMDHGWIVTFAAAPLMAAPQISIASEGGSGTPVPDLSIEVDDLDAVLGRAKAAGYEIAYGPRQEPWGVRRFYLRDPFGRLVNVLTHSPD
ncbi:VOC family protein [Acetobacteraceae bacterium H6797]|nr:VOC family protein [Acetobacteraceae bacterium H6797]